MIDNASDNATQRALNEGVARALNAAFLLIGDEAGQRKLQDEKQAAQVLEKFKLPESSRTGLLNVMNRVGHKVSHSVSDSVERLSKANPKDVQEIAASQIQLLNSYYHISLDQARRSFYSALAAAGIGLIFFLAAIGFLLFKQPSEGVASASIISGSLVEVISAINFYLYGKTSAQFAEFHTRLGHTQRYLLANSLCEGLEGDFKQQARVDLVKAIGGVE
jgi:hypothetical protein